MTSSHLVLEALSSPAAVQQLSTLKAAPDTLTKWQQTNAMLVQATLHVIPQIGFTADLPGLQAYTEAFAEQMRSDQPETRKALQELNSQKWGVLLKHVFDCEPAPSMSLADARAIAIALVDAMQDPTLLKQVGEARTGLAARMSEQEQHAMVARALVGVQQEVLAKHGYAGEQGFAQANVCLMQHAADAVVSASVAHATNTLYARAGINLAEVMQRATAGG